MLKKRQNRFSEVEFNFRKRLYSEMVYNFGFEAKYIKKENLKPNITLQDFEMDIFNDSKDVVVICAGIQNFENNSMGNKFGFEIDDSASLFLDTKQASELNIIPKRGDLVYFKNLNNRIFEITFTTTETDLQKFHYGNMGVAYQLDVELYDLDITDNFATKTNLDKINTKENIHKNNDKYDIKQDLEQVFINNNPLLDK